jgi:hypothetical protein
MGLCNTESADSYTFFYGNGNDNHELVTGLSVHKRIISAVKMVQFVSDRMSYVHVQTKDKADDLKTASMRK